MVLIWQNRICSFQSPTKEYVLNCLLPNSYNSCREKNYWKIDRSVSSTFPHLYQLSLFILCVFDVLLTLERLPLLSHFLEIIINSVPVRAPFKCKPINLEPIPKDTPFIGFSHPGPLFLCRNHPRARYQTARNSLRDC